MTAAVLANRSASDGFVRLAASVRPRADADQVVALLDGDDLPWAREPMGDREGVRRHAVDLRLRVGGEAAGVTTFAKAAYVDLGRPRRAADGWQAEIGWRASTAAPLFPVFSGHLLIRPGELRVEGLYAPPGGVVGRVADRVLLHVAANATARWLLEEIDRAAADRAR